MPQWGRTVAFDSRSKFQHAPMHAPVLQIYLDINICLIYALTSAQWLVTINAWSCILWTGFVSHAHKHQTKPHLIWTQVYSFRKFRVTNIFVDWQSVQWTVGVPDHFMSPEFGLSWSMQTCIFGSEEIPCVEIERGGYSWIVGFPNWLNYEVLVGEADY